MPRTPYESLKYGFKLKKIFLKLFVPQQVCGSQMTTFSLFFKNIYLFVYYVYSILSAGQKRTPGFITDGCEPPYGCWELNSGPLEEQAMLLTTEPSLQSPANIFKLNQG